MFNDCLIMAGGSGTRLWPASSSRLPKQFLPAAEIPGGEISSNKKISFFSMALERSLAVGERVIVIAGKSHIPHVIADAAKLSAAEKKRILVIGEPAAKNTAPAAACAVAYSRFSGRNRKMLVLTSDHIIKPLDVFKADAESAAVGVETPESKLAVFGISPTRPETDYGYIETTSHIEKKNNRNQSGIYTVAAFHEKPDLATAKKFTANKHFFWNSGMFAFNVDFMAEQFLSLAPDVYRPFEKLKQPTQADFTVTRGIKVLTGWKGLEAAYNKTKSISFDYAIAEKCGNTIMVRVNFDWIDIGNWEEYSKICGNTNSLVFNEEADNCFVDSDIPVAIAGVEDLIVVIRSGKNGAPAAALITKKGQTQKVGGIVNQIKSTGNKELL